MKYTIKEKSRPNCMNVAYLIDYKGQDDALEECIDEFIKQLG